MISYIRRIVMLAAMAAVMLPLPMHAATGGDDAPEVLSLEEPAAGEVETYSAVVRGVTRHDGQIETELGMILRNDQALDVEILNGSLRGRRVTVQYDAVALDSGDRLFVQRLVTPDGHEHFAVEEPDRRRSLAVLAAIFVAAVLALGRWQGVRALCSLALSLAIIVAFLIPRILGGSPPVPWSAAVAIVILALSIAFTHGIRRSSFAAFLGTAVAVALTAILASLAVGAAHLTGLADEAAFYLDVEAGGRIDLRGLLLGAIIIGAIGVLDDIAITQATAVEELHAAAPTMTSRALFRRSLRIGREHVGALVNTLALAYAGAALPILLLIHGASVPIDRLLNREMFSVEIVRTIVGSIGIIAAVPLTTWFAVALRSRPGARSAATDASR